MCDAARNGLGARDGALGIVHVHSDYSHDGRDLLVSIRDRAAAAGVRFVALTDHAEDFDEERFRQFCDECATLSDGVVKLYPGLEFRFARHRGLHLLALGLRGWVKPLTPEAFIAEVTGIAALTIVAHPVLAEYRIPEAVRAGIGGIEVWNAAYNTRYLPDPGAIALLQDIQRRRPDVVGIAGLDQHDGSNDRGIRVLLIDPADLTNPLEALRAGRFMNWTRMVSFGPHPSWTGPRLGLLIAGRTVLDVVERVQERLARAWRRRRAYS